MAKNALPGDAFRRFVSVFFVLVLGNAGCTGAEGGGGPEATEPSPEVTVGQAASALEVGTCVPPTSRVVINELMIDPLYAGDANGEFVEVHNPSGTAVDLEGWTLKDLGTDVHVIGQSVVVEAGGYAVLCRNANFQHNGGVVCAYQYSNFVLANTGGDAVILLDGKGEEVDRVEYTGTAPEGYTVELRHPFLADAELTIPAQPEKASSWEGMNWSVATVGWAAGSLDSGTPGGKNADVWQEQEFAGCGDGDGCTWDLCVAGKCAHPRRPDCCVTNGDCEDGKPCTKDRCDTVTKRCGNTPIPECCSQNADCVDEDPCNIDYCGAYLCRHGANPLTGCCWAPEGTNPVTGEAWDAAARQAYADGQCNDGHFCTTDTCDLGNARCQHAAKADCCEKDSDCLDPDPCTRDRCVENGCVFEPIPGCCKTDADCDDGDKCTKDICIVKYCVHLFDMTQCCATAEDCPDDGNPCTAQTCEGQKCKYPYIEDCKQGLPYIERFDTAASFPAIGWKRLDYKTPVPDHWAFSDNGDLSMDGGAFDQFLKFSWNPTTLNVKTVTYTPILDGLDSQKDFLNWLGVTTVEWRMTYRHAPLGGPVTLRVVASANGDFANGTTLYAETVQDDLEYSIRSFELPEELKFSPTLRVGFMVETTTTFNLDDFEIDDVKVAPGRANKLMRGILVQCTPGVDCELYKHPLELARKDFGIPDVAIGVNGWQRLFLCYRDDDTQTQGNYFGLPAAFVSGPPMEPDVPVKPFEAPAGTTWWYQGCRKVNGYVAMQDCGVELEHGFICAVDVEPKGDESTIGSHRVGIIAWDEWDPKLSNHNPYETLNAFSLTVLPESGYVVWSPTGVDDPRAKAVLSAIRATGREANLVTDIRVLQDDALAQRYAGVFAVLGVHGNHHAMTSEEAAKLKKYLSAGGRLYLEGGDFFYTSETGQPATVLHPMFGVDGTSDGSLKLTGTLVGANFLLGRTFGYDTDASVNASIDRLRHTPEGGGREILRSGTGTFATVVSYESPDTEYRTVGSSVLFGGVVDPKTSTTCAATPLTEACQALMESYLDFLENGYPPCAQDTECDDFEVCTNDGCAPADEGEKHCFNDPIPGCVSCKDDCTKQDGTPSCDAASACLVSQGYCAPILPAKLVVSPDGGQLPKTLDKTHAQVSAKATVLTTGTVMDVNVKVKVTHTYRGDLRLTLSHEGTTVMLKNENPADAADDVCATYDFGVSLPDGASLDGFIGMPVSGEWVVTAIDTDPDLNNGVFVDWRLFLGYEPDDHCANDGDCDDKEVCTTDQCKNGECVHTPVADQTVCQAASCDALLYTAPKVCIAGACSGGGATQSCDDGKACTTDTCSTAQGCGHTLKDGTCLIGGVCYAEGDKNPSNPCQACLSGKELEWSALPDGTVCQEAACTGLLTKTFRAVKTCSKGACTVGGETEICDDGLACTADSCSTDTGCATSLFEGACVIEGACYYGDACRVQGCVVFVDAGAEPFKGDCGDSWATACLTVQEGLFRAGNLAQEMEDGSCEVWVKEGVYYAWVSGEEDTFDIPEGVSLYGGFAGTEISRLQRDWVQHPTVLSGCADAACDAAVTDGTCAYDEDQWPYPDYLPEVCQGGRVRHVVVAHARSTLDGFTIRGGMAIDNDWSGDRWMDSGAGLWVEGPDVTIRNSMFTRNYSTGYGAGLYITNFSEGMIQVTVESSRFADNYCEGWGGGGAVAVEWGTSIDFENVAFVRNRTGYDGGAVYLQEDNEGRFDGCTFEDNFSWDYGGAIYGWSLPSLVLHDCRFDGNHAEYEGGAVFVDTAAEVAFVGCRFQDNHAEEYGGAITGYTLESMSIEECLFVGNSAGYYGGALELCGNWYGPWNPEEPDWTLNVSSTTFSRNRVVYGLGTGGAVDLWSFGPSRFTDSRFVDNGLAGPEGNGGAVFYGGNPAEFDRCMFTGNWATANGGAVGGYQWSAPSPAAFTNCLFTGNVAGWHGRADGGGAIDVDSDGWTDKEASLSITNCTFAENVIDNKGKLELMLGIAEDNDNPGTAIRIRAQPPSAVSIVNSVLWDVIGEGDVEVQAIGLMPFISHSDVRGGDKGNANLDDYPMFAGDPATGGQWTSVVYDAEHHVTRLIDSSASWAPGSLVGKIVLPKAGDPRRHLIASNVSTEIRVLGDLTQDQDIEFMRENGKVRLVPHVQAGDTWRIFDLSLAGGSPCIDAADDDAAPETDLIGRPRVGPADMGAFESSAEAIPCEDNGDCPGKICIAGMFLPAWRCVEGICRAEPAEDCADGLDCTEDSCDPDAGCGHQPKAGYCLIDGECHADGEAHLDWDYPDALCEFCDVSRSTTAWSLGCGGVCCPVMWWDYTASCNARAHCEYANVNPTGWRQWDTWIWMPPATFTMGSPEAETGHQVSEAPAHEVTIPRGSMGYTDNWEECAFPFQLENWRQYDWWYPEEVDGEICYWMGWWGYFGDGFLIGKYEVTVAQYEAIQSCDGGMCPVLALAENPSNDEPDAHPQTGLTIVEAAEVCASSTMGFGRLPTEAEWEYAASGTTHRKYPWGDGPEPDCAVHAIFDPAGDGSQTGCGAGGTWPVGSRAAGVSASGAMDMSGNVSEWVMDEWRDSYADEDVPTDGSAVGGWDFWEWEAGGVDTAIDRVVRGGAFLDSVSMLRSSARSKDAPMTQRMDRGVRCVRYPWLPE